MVKGITLYWLIACFPYHLFQHRPGDACIRLGACRMDDFLLTDGAIQIIRTKAERELSNRHRQHNPERLDMVDIVEVEECRLTQEQMADRVGKKRASVANQLRLLKLPAKVQHDLKVGLVSVGHAKVLLGVEDPKVQEALCDLIVRRGLSVRQLEEKVKALEKGEPEEKEPQELPEMYYRLLENVGRYFGDNISLRRTSAGKGSITIRFDSDEQMERFLQALDPNRG